MKINIKIGDKELRTTEESGRLYLEVVKWDIEEQSCITVMYWTPFGEEEVTLKTVGDRVVDYMTPDEFMFFHKIGNQVLNNLGEWRHQ